MNEQGVTRKRHHLPALACIGALCLCFFTTNTPAAALEAIVSGVQAVTSGGSPGPVFGVSANWSAIVGGDDDTSQPSTLIMARTFDAGRVVAMGHDGLLSEETLALLDNTTLMTNIIHWLRGAGGLHIHYTTGHSEWANGEALGAVLAAAGYTTSAMDYPITSEKLVGASVLIVGNAWGAFTEDEIQAVREFVSEGGGLLLSGLGWSWPVYNPGKTIEDYPVMQIGAPYGCRWLTPGIADPTDNLNDSPVFHTFYPDVVSCSLGGAMTVITNTHSFYGASLPAALETNATLRSSFVAAHASLAVPSTEFPMANPARQEVFQFYLSLLQTSPNAYARTAPFDENAYPTTTWLRERVWRTLRDCVPLDDGIKNTLANATQLTGLARDIFVQFGVAVLDNCRLATNQLNYILSLLSLIPAELHNLKSISVEDFLGTPPTSIALEGTLNAVNIFGIPIEDWVENAFPADVPSGNISVFCAATAHEMNHVVDAWTIAEGTPYASRKRQLISDAGEVSENYLRSMFEPAFFLAAPQEFFASIVNQWFTDSARTVELGLVRYNAGITNPINQALFIADIYSQGGAWTSFYNTDPAGCLTRRSVPLRRDGQGRITGIQLETNLLSFALGRDGNVTKVESIATTPPSIQISLSGTFVRLAWPEFPLGFSLESTLSIELPWSPFTNQVNQAEGWRAVEFPLEPNSRLFRLRSAGP